jgi:hypothetical protein
MEGGGYITTGMMNINSTLAPITRYVSKYRDRKAASLMLLCPKPLFALILAKCIFFSFLLFQTWKPFVEEIFPAKHSYELRPLLIASPDKSLNLSTKYSFVSLLSMKGCAVLHFYLLLLLISGLILSLQIVNSIAADRFPSPPLVFSFPFLLFFSD